MQLAGDEAVNDLKHKTGECRRVVARDQLLGIGGHEEMLRRYRGNAKVTDAHSRRIAKKLYLVSPWGVTERAFGDHEADNERSMGELMGAFDRSSRAAVEDVKKVVERNYADKRSH